ncbi:MAG: MFS transporter, partial [Methylobacteriaceae bacterium]|nr:MFS transporter [Methylobacteriaceae bacterium]
GGCLQTFVIVGLTSGVFSVYLPYLINDYHFTNTQTSTLIALRASLAFAALFLMTGYLRLLDIRLGLAVAGLCSAASFFLYGFAADNYPVALVAACLAGMAYGFGGMVPVTIIIGRWFKDHNATALGFCAAGSGVAAIAGPIAITALTETFSVPAAFTVESGVITLIVAVIFLLVRNRPIDTPTEPDAPAPEVGGVPVAPAEGPGMSRRGFLLMLAGITMLGGFATTGNAHLAVLFRSEGFTAVEIALLLSAEGIAMTVGKGLFGVIADAVGTFRANFLYFLVAIAGYALCMVSARTHDTALAVTAVSLAGVGLSLATVGLAVWVTELSSAAEFERNVKRMQIAYVSGAVLVGVMPGFLADTLGSYIPAYIIFTGFAAATMVIVQTQYVIQGTHRGKNKH